MYLDLLVKRTRKNVHTLLKNNENTEPRNVNKSIIPGTVCQMAPIQLFHQLSTQWLTEKSMA
jgi:hypothetical protein